MKELRTERLILREWELKDSKDLYEYAKSQLVGPNAGWMPHENEEKSKKIIGIFIENQETYAIVLKSENKVIGSIGLHDRKPDKDIADLKQREVGYVLNPKYWGRGIVPEALNELIRHSFEDLDLDLIWCGHYDFNNNSKRVAEKCGFKYRFTKKEKIKALNDKEVNTLYYSIYKND